MTDQSEPTDVAGGVTDEELIALAHVVHRLMNCGHERGAIGALNLLARSQQARGVMAALDHIRGTLTDEEKNELRALAERLWKGQL